MATTPRVTSRQQPRPSGGRGADSAHTDDAVLDLVAAVVRAAAADPGERVAVPERVSMRAFDRVKPVVDRARGIADPEDDAQRTPTAAGIHLRFNKGTSRSITWKKIVAAALKADRTMWLASARRAERAAEPLSDEQLAFALRMVADQLGVRLLRRQAYREKRDALVAADLARYGEDSVLARVLPSLNHVDGQMRWEQALSIAGLPAQDEVPQKRERPGLPLAQAAACYAALNGSWPSRVVLRAFAKHSGFALPDFNKGVNWADVLADARELLVDHGVAPPADDGPKSGGRG